MNQKNTSQPVWSDPQTIVNKPVVLMDRKLHMLSWKFTNEVFMSLEFYGHFLQIVIITATLYYVCIILNDPTSLVKPSKYYF